MKRIVILLAVALVVVATHAVAQEAAPPGPTSAVATLASSFGEVAGYITSSAELMPEADFAFKPTPEVRSFGQIIGHVAEVNYLLCALAVGEDCPAKDVEKTMTGKAELVEAVRTSFTYCEAAFAMSDAKAGELIDLWGDKKPRLTALTINLTHDWEHYGNLVTYLRIKGLVPPSSQPSQ